MLPHFLLHWLLAAILAYARIMANSQQANAVAGLDTINFNIGGGARTITPGSALPGIGDPVIIDATTQPGYAGTPLIRLDGVSAGSGTSGLYLWAGGSTVKGLMITRFSGDGITLDGGGGGNTFSDNFIGTNGSADLGNGIAGLRIENAPNNTVANNLVSGNNDDGINIVGAGASGNVIRGNKAGTDITGTLVLGNTWEGILIDGAPGNTVIGNLTSGNHTGVYIYGAGATGNSIQGNKVGTDVTGTLALGNSNDGIIVNQAPGNTIGGTAAGAGNLVAANGDDGIDLTSGSTGNVVLGNKIGTTLDGTSALGNTLARHLCRLGARQYYRRR